MNNVEVYKPKTTAFQQCISRLLNKQGSTVGKKTSLSLPEKFKMLKKADAGCISKRR